MKPFRLSCPCHFGLESVLAGEMKRLGFSSVSADNGRVSFAGGFEEIARANLHLRTAERVQIELASFPAYTFEELFTGVNRISFEELLSKTSTFPVTGYALNSKLASVPDCQSIIKKAVVKRLQSVYGGAWLEETGPIARIQFGILKNIATIFLDTSGPGLHKRGYRAISTEAPIKETLAAGIVDLARVKSDSLVVDPFCGSGTILIEAGLKALGIAPGINRRFQVEQWEVFEADIMRRAREEAIEMVNRAAIFHGIGSDIDPAAVALTIENAKKAGIGKRLEIRTGDVRNFSPPTEQSAIIITNPPYGERLLDLQAAVKIYQDMGLVFPDQKALSYYIISSYEDFEAAFGRPAKKRRKLYNGSLKCQLYMYF